MKVLHLTLKSIYDYGWSISENIIAKKYVTVRYKGQEVIGWAVEDSSTEDEEYYDIIPRRRGAYIIIELSHCWGEEIIRCERRYTVYKWDGKEWVKKEFDTRREAFEFAESM